MSDETNDDNSAQIKTTTTPESASPEADPNVIKWGIIAVIVGVVTGSIVNMGLILIGPTVIPLPEGVDNSTMESLQAGMDLMGPKDFLFPYLAHALGTLVGAFFA
ncbi:MAG: hypothetical protein AAF483_31165, partial [Planctomycetota bacterium]